MPAKIPCPDRQVLQRLMLGQLPADQVEPLAQHLEECGQCTTAVRTLHAEDPFLETVREQAPAPQAPESPAVRELVDRLRQLGPASITTALCENSVANLSAGTDDWTDLLSPAREADELGWLGSYRVLQALGAGGMGVVFRAEDSQLKRPVALKVMKPTLVGSASARQRFLREAQAAAAIKHDHIVTIYQVGEDRGAPFLAMELLHGASLDDRLKQNARIPWHDAVRIGREMALALAAAHKAGLIHRDIKPANVWLEADTNRVKILDFGLARLTQQAGHLTQEGTILGTPAYMAPEQAAGLDVDARGDLFSLGCVLYHLTAGRLPFQGKDLLTRMMALASEQPPPPRDVNPEIPAVLSDLILKLLAKKPEDRPGSALAVAQDLGKIVDETDHPQPAGRESLPPKEAAPKPWRSRRVPVFLAVAAALLLVAGGSLLIPQIILRITDKEGKTTDIVLKPGEKFEVVQPKKEGPAGPNILPDKAKPFVVTWADGKTREEFRDFAEVLKVLQDGDAIEVHGNGPFTIPAVSLTKKGLKLRAAPGYRSVFVTNEASPPDTWFYVADAPLVVEGCDFHCRAGSHVLGGGGAPWEFRNCRIFSVTGNHAIHYSGPKLRFTDCLLCTQDVTPYLRLEAKAEAALSNNIVVAFNLIELLSPGGQTLRLENNTFRTGAFIGLPDAKQSEPISVTAKGNIFSGDPGTGLSGWTEAWKGRFHWKGERNLYAGNLIVYAPDQQWLSSSFDDWIKLLGREPGSRPTADLVFAWDAPRRQAPEATVEWLKRQSEMLRKQHRLADLGPNWDLVGPGEAYVRALSAQGRAVPKDQLRPPANNRPFVILRGGKLVSGSATLAETVEKVVDGDTIEIRDDGPLAAGQFAGSGRKLTLRAAPGYRPVLEGGFGSDDIWTIEGVHFRKGLLSAGDAAKLKITRLVNCSLEDVPDGTGLFATLVSNEGKPAEIVHCLMPFQILAKLPAGEKLIVRHSVVGNFQFLPADEGRRQLELENCIIYPGRLSATVYIYEAGPLAVTARDTWLEGTPINSGKLCAGWKGTRNLYRVGQRFWCLDEGIFGLAAWRQRWRSAEEGSATADPLAYDPLAWQLLPSVPDASGYGANVSQVARTVQP